MPVYVCPSCGKRIEGEEYLEDGYGRRFHVQCAVLSSLPGFTDIEKRILARHRFIPKVEIYHLTDRLESILQMNILHTGPWGMISLTANPRLTYVIPERTPRRHRLVLDFLELRKDYGRWLFPVYYFTDDEWYEEKPPNWLVSYYEEKGVGVLVEDLTYWAGAESIYLGKNLFSQESEWKCMRNIMPVKKYLKRTESVRKS